MVNVNKLWKWSLLFFFGGAVVSIVTAGRRKMWYTLDELSALNNCDSVWQVCVTMTVRLFFALFFLNIFNVSAFDSFLPQHFFTSFGARDRSFMMIFRLWQNALLDKVLTHYTLPHYLLGVKLSDQTESELFTSDKLFVSMIAIKCINYSPCVTIWG